MTIVGANCPLHGFWPTGGNFCPQCGKAMTPATNDCATCGRPVEPLGANFCRHCGQATARP